MLTDFVHDLRDAIGLSGRIDLGIEVQGALRSAAAVLPASGRNRDDIAAPSPSFDRRLVQRAAVLVQRMMSGRHKVRGIENRLLVERLPPRNRPE